ncbi:hypothetical protein BS47DRAFT_777171 [Hydnum rufescens UP504]|uniref:Uncharacterized protein n=1 Tax=Hydnum rufescens UP504 TaxID=1448309 RepID=A0A9P6AE64_9AGAM|nr:hypothetical protein BS47DRAFT_777171 [Hydnum rufescens UP504]
MHTAHGSGHKVSRDLGGCVEGKNIDDMRIASSLHILTRNLMAIHTDATRWSDLNVVERYLQRDKIMNAISMHGENLTDCLHTFQVNRDIDDSIQPSG